MLFVFGNVDLAANIHVQMQLIGMHVASIFLHHYI